MKRNRISPGAELFKRGDPADRLYILAEGRLEVEENGRPIEAGLMFGEIGFFAPEGRRTGTVRCVEAATVLSMDETAFRQLLFQNPAFGLEIMALIARGLSYDVRRLQTQIESRTEEPPAAH